MAIKVDLLPTERKKFGFDIVIALMVLLVIGAFVVCYWYGGVLDKRVSDAAAKVEQAEKTLENEKKGLENIDGLEKKIAELKSNIKTVKTLKLDPVRYSNLLDELSSLLPNNMWVSSISIDTQKNTLTLVGVAVEQPGVRPVESISGFMKSVSKSKYFTNAVISSTTRGKTNVGDNEYTSYSWSMELQYNPDKAIGKI
jgi:Tfp pilus assembly protein PilN